MNSNNKSDTLRKRVTFLYADAIDQKQATSVALVPPNVDTDQNQVTSVALVPHNVDTDQKQITSVALVSLNVSNEQKQITSNIKALKEQQYKNITYVQRYQAQDEKLKIIDSKINGSFIYESISSQTKELKWMAGLFAISFLPGIYKGWRIWKENLFICVSNDNGKYQLPPYAPQNSTCLTSYKMLSTSQTIMILAGVSIILSSLIIKKYYALTTPIQNLVDPDDAKIINDIAEDLKLDITGTTASKDVKHCVNKLKNNTRDIIKTRPGALLFFMNTSPYMNDPNNKIAEFLGCEDLPKRARLINLKGLSPTIRLFKNKTTSSDKAKPMLQAPDIYTPEFWM